MNFELKAEEQILFIELEGRLLGNQDEFVILSQIEIYQEEGIKYAAIDLSKLELINSAGIGLLMRILVRFRNKDGEVCLINPSQNIQKLLIITKLTALFSIVPDRSEAKKCLLELS